MKGVPKTEKGRKEKLAIKHTNTHTYTDIYTHTHTHTYTHIHTHTHTHTSNNMHKASKYTTGHACICHLRNCDLSHDDAVVGFGRIRASPRPFYPYSLAFSV